MSFFGVTQIQTHYIDVVRQNTTGTTEAGDPITSYVTTESDIPAVISGQSGSELTDGAEEGVELAYTLVCDPCGLNQKSYVRDRDTHILYEVITFNSQSTGWLGMDFVQARIKRIVE